MWADFTRDRIVPVSGIATEADFRHFAVDRQLMLHLLAHTFAPLTNYATVPPNDGIQLKPPLILVAISLHPSRPDFPERLLMSIARPFHFPGSHVG